MTLDEALDRISVSPKEVHDQAVVGTWWPDSLPWAVEDDKGVMALFSTQAAACHYRLLVINQKLNQGWEIQP